MRIKILTILFVFLITGCGHFCTSETCCLKPYFLESCQNTKNEYEKTIIDQASYIQGLETKIENYKSEVNQFNQKAQILDLSVSTYELQIKKLKNKIKTLESKAKEIKEYWHVTRGDWLSSIANKLYGNLELWPLIYWTNTDIITDPNLIYPEQILKIQRNWDDQKKDDAVKYHKLIFKQ